MLNYRVERAFFFLSKKFLDAQFSFFSFFFLPCCFVGEVHVDERGDGHGEGPHHPGRRGLFWGDGADVGRAAARELHRREPQDHLLQARQERLPVHVRTFTGEVNLMPTEEESFFFFKINIYFLAKK